MQRRPMTKGRSTRTPKVCAAVGTCNLTSALWRAEEGAQRRYASVAHQRAVRRQRHARLSDLACGRVHTRTKRKVRQKHSRAVAPIPKDRAFREGPRLKTSRATQSRPWSLSQVARG